MVFWRNRSAKKTEASGNGADGGGTAASGTPGSGSQGQTAQTNVVTLVTSRLADRLADVANLTANLTERSAEPQPKDSDDRKGEEAKPPSSIPASAEPHFFGQKRAVAKIRAALAARPGQHLIIFGEAGSGRVALAKALAREVARRPGMDWIYVIERDAPSRAKAFAVPAGEGSRLARDLRAALDRASSAFQRHMKSEEYRISLDLLDEELRYRGESAVEQVRRRAEAQNIAVVKSLDGYVLAPMHEGRVVRSDVFRALPEALKRNVESKITALENELQSIVATLPEVEFEVSEKFGALNRQTALRAIRPSLEPVKRSCGEDASAVAAIDAIENAFLESSAAGPGADGKFEPITILNAEDLEPSGGEAERGVQIMRHVSAAQLLGEIGLDGRGRPALIPGELMRAGSGIVIIEAWRLAADPEAWMALSAALATKEIRPRAAAGIAIKADPVPLMATIVLIADEQSWSKLEAIEPGIGRHFPHVAKLAATAAMADLGEDEFSKGAAWLAAEHDLKPLNPAVAPILYKDAVRRGGGRVSLAGIPLLQLLREADAVARSHSAIQIRASDVNEALAGRADREAP